MRAKSGARAHMVRIDFNRLRFLVVDGIGTDDPAARCERGPLRLDHHADAGPEPKHVVLKGDPLPGKDDPVSRAEQGLAGLSGQFETWMKTECERLDQARRDVRTQGFNAMRAV
jgi:hypothetical protein